MKDKNFLNLYSHNFVRVAVAIPTCHIADPASNAEEIIALAKCAWEKGSILATFPELGLSAYTCEDLFHQRILLDNCETALATIIQASATLLPLVIIIGLPLRVGHQLFNCAAVISGGEIQGIVPKNYLPNYGEFYEMRQFSPADNAINRQIELLGSTIPFGTKLLFEVKNLPLLRFHIEICEDVWAPIPPSSFGALAGASVLVNLSASNAVVGKAMQRHKIIGQQSMRCLSAYLYASASRGESSNDSAWDGHGIIYENGELLAESERFLEKSQIIFADIDLEILSKRRMCQNTFSQSMRHYASEIEEFKIIRFELDLRLGTPLPLIRTIDRFPYIPSDPQHREEYCTEVYNIQIQALSQRLLASKISKVVIGVSGGLDSTYALLVCAKVMDRLNLPRSNILAYTMPGFATSDRTLSQATQIMKAVGVTATEIDIRPSCLQMFKDLGHPYAENQEQFDITFENVQAGERTSHLFRLANFNDAIVIGTGDLSEIALGWCTYGVGDHMSHYNINAGVPKTLIRQMVHWVAQNDTVGINDYNVLLNVLNTNVSPELVPEKSSATSEHVTEKYIGPYELQDFNLYHTIHHGFTPSKIAFLAFSAWQKRSKETGDWSDYLRVNRNIYNLSEIKCNLRIFLSRFFHNSQFKRSCVPNSPKVSGSGSLSPRSDWRAPSDSEATAWLSDLQSIPDHLNDCS
jgi:NAD+ synthase (glutamine-hydrolysing)